jgi:hemerythrin
MTLIKPEDCAKLDIPEIDAQHETLIGLINQIHASMLEGTGKAALDELLSALLAHTESHFEYEERLMAHYDYPAYEGHKAEHARLIEHLSDLIGRYQSGELLLSFAVVLELKGWACIHIESLDMPLGAFLSDREGVD